MKKRIAEQSVLFVSVLKWTAFASLVGVIVGASTTLFLKALGYAGQMTAGLPYFYLALPLMLFVSNLLAEVIDKDAAGEGLDKVIDSVHKDFGAVKLITGPTKFIASIVTITGGGSVGKEAPPVQVGAALISSIAGVLKMDKVDRRKLVICAISAGFASVFGAPIAGAVFGIESLFLGQMLYDVLLPSFVAGIVAYQVSVSFGVTYFAKEITIIPVFTSGFFVKVIIAGMVFGLVALMLIEAMKLSGYLFGKVKFSAPMKGALAGFALLGATLLLDDKRYLGLGMDTIEGVLLGGHTPAPAFLVKILFTAVTLGAGASGGIITPIFFVGATSGSLLGRLMGFDPATFAAIGMVAVLAGAANTPVAAGILAMELFGVKVGPWAATASVVSYLMVGHRSIHASQVVAGLKSSSVRMPVKKAIAEAKADIEVRVREKGVLGLATRFLKGAKPKRRKKV